MLFCTSWPPRFRAENSVKRYVPFSLKFFIWGTLRRLILLLPFGMILGLGMGRVGIYYLKASDSMSFVFLKSTCCDDLVFFCRNPTSTSLLLLFFNIDGRRISTGNIFYGTTTFSNAARDGRKCCRMLKGSLLNKSLEVRRPEKAYPYLVLSRF